MGAVFTDARYAIAIHGGAGVIDSSAQSKVDAAMEGLRVCLSAGLEILKAGGSALDAVEAAVVALENDPQFNAGKGAVYTRDCKHELEASIMSSNQTCGAASLLRRVKNPVKVARAVMEHTPHVFLAGEPADSFAEQMGLEMVNNSYFNTPHRLQQWERYKTRGVLGRQDEIVQHTQTVGAVAIDQYGVLAAATSTGGRTNKWDGRIGDTPLIASGTWANTYCAVSGTGVGEEFIRHAVAHDVAARVEYKRLSLHQAVEEVVHGVLRPGDGGVIAVDGEYNIVLDFNGGGMYRGAADHTGKFEVAIHKGLGQKL